MSLHLAYPRLCTACGIVHRPQPARRLAHDLRPYDALYLSALAKGLMLDALDETATGGADFGALHTAYSTTGTSEVTGGSPAYARKALVWSAASGGSKALAATLPTWDVPAGTTVAWVGLWDAVTTGGFLGMMPAGGGPLLYASMQIAADVATTNDIYVKAHGLVANDRVVFWGAIPGGLTVGTTIYYVLAAGLTADTFNVALTAGGAEIDITGTAPFVFFAQKCVPETFAGQGTYALSSGSIDLAAVA